MQPACAACALVAPPFPHSLTRTYHLPLLHVSQLLNVSYNRLTSLDDLRQSGSLKVLYARSNRISDVGGASGLASLVSLDLECNALASLEALAPLWGCKALTELRLRGNLISSGSYRRAGLAHLPMLKRLDGADVHAGSSVADGSESADGVASADAGGDDDGGDDEEEDEEDEEGEKRAMMMTEAVERWMEVCDLHRSPSTPAPLPWPSLSLCVFACR